MDLLRLPTATPSFQMLWRTLIYGLGLTWLLEWAAVAVILRRSNLRIASAVLLINALTEPLAVATFNELQVNFYVIEVVVCLVEFPLYRLLLQVSWKQAGLISVVANTLSAAVSFLV
jgi:predicted Kef-type K+ transport protein